MTDAVEIVFFALMITISFGCTRDFRVKMLLKIKLPGDHGNVFFNSIDPNIYAYIAGAGSVEITHDVRHSCPATPHVLGLLRTRSERPRGPRRRAV